MDDELRRRARAARAEVEAQVDVEAELAGRAEPTTSGITPITPLPPRSRIVALTGSIAAVAIAIVGGIVLFQGSDSIETTEPTAPTAATSIVPAPSAAPTTTGPVSTTTSPGRATTTVGSTTTTVVGATGTAAVSYLDPPPMASLTPLGVVSVPEPTAGMYQVAIGDLGVAVSTRTYEPASARLDIVGFDGTTRSFDDVSYDHVIAYGPGDVVYTTIGEPMADFAVAAIPVSGDRAAEVVASDPANVNEHLEYPPASYGHGATGVTMRRYGGKIAIGYVDVDGNPISLDTAPTLYDSDTFGLDEGQVTITASTGASWSVSIDAHPDDASPYVGPSPAAPTTSGDGVFWTHIGPNLAPDIDFGEPSQWVVAQLHPGGSATWWSLPDGWTIAASDIWGTVAVRQQGEELEVALVDFTSDEQPAPTTTTTNTAPPTVPTTVPSSAVLWRSLRWEDAGFDRACSGIEFESCTQLLVDRDGSTVSYDPTTARLTRHSTPPIETALPESVAFGSFLWHLGPDGVVYLGVPGDPQRELGVDVVAVTLAPGDAGREIARWRDLEEVSGDSELAATREGLVALPCCGPEIERPDPQARVLIPWLDRDGQETSIEGPIVRVEVDSPRLTIHRDDGGTRSWTVEPSGNWQPRGMPSVLPTFDGGFIAWTFGSNVTAIRGWVDGSVSEVAFDDSLVYVNAMDPSGRMIVTDGDRFARFEPFADRTEFWAGRPEVADDGTVTLPDIDTAIDDEAGWARNPVAFGNAVAGPLEINERRTVELTRPTDSEFVVEVTTSNHFDDSVFATRLELILRRDEDGRFRFVSGQWTQACQPGRGQQEFSADLCV